MLAALVFDLRDYFTLILDDRHLILVWANVVEGARLQLMLHHLDIILKRRKHLIGRSGL